MTFCLDSHIVIWGVKRRGERVAEAREFIAWADANAHRLLVPAVAVHEMLVHATRDDQRAAWLHVLQTEFMVAAFDLGAAEHAARLESSHARPREANRYKERFDIQIVATALRYEADAIVSYDRDVRRIAEGHVAVRGFGEPGTLFGGT